MIGQVDKFSTRNSWQLDTIIKNSSATGALRSAEPKAETSVDSRASRVDSPVHTSGLGVKVRCNHVSGQLVVKIQKTERNGSMHFAQNR